MNQDEEEGEASRSTCLRVVDSGEDPELHETPGVSSTDPQDLLRAAEMIKESEMMIPRGRPALGRPIAKEHHQPQ